ncbi:MULTISPECIES: hypothetical protein [Streptomyces]|uniref:hypothetical protein n=1 Tax=Streptomyces TaxID=1883 RepID=UPI00163C63BD|nr:MULTISPECIES: hypothetical protein [Streptomyces]MBC2873884.1 hypothetical protein [Streptomyces sp. TYQ1024]UBI39171.1 hypothetical protein K7I03_23755 [Streptomyces mobaraensis]UKW31751.1 hypothetical protein MCU78_23695 [Streptomyces sp. TYQ1024]
MRGQAGAAVGGVGTWYGRLLLLAALLLGIVTMHTLGHPMGHGRAEAHTSSSSIGALTPSSGARTPSIGTRTSSAVVLTPPPGTRTPSTVTAPGRDASEPRALTAAWRASTAPGTPSATAVEHGDEPQARAAMATKPATTAARVARAAPGGPPALRAAYAIAPPAQAAVGDGPAAHRTHPPAAPAGAAAASDGAGPPPPHHPDLNPASVCLAVLAGAGWTVVLLLALAVLRRPAGAAGAGPRALGAHALWAVPPPPPRRKALARLSVLRV